MSAASGEQAATRAIDGASDALRALSLDIHAHPQENYLETHAHGVLTDFLDANSWEVQRGAYGMETAFQAERGAGGPCITRAL